ncbi:hypothetical protein HDU96_008564 [Phlyctochytrium bullatum]|nr:hypothetical protein HDU96_008564 [Phlyctochytrium bullatum]
MTPPAAEPTEMPPTLSTTDIDSDQDPSIDNDDPNLPASHTEDHEEDPESLEAQEATASGPRSTDVVYLNLRGIRFCVSSEVLSLFPDSILMALFPSGLIAFFPAPTDPPEASQSFFCCSRLDTPVRAGAVDNQDPTTAPSSPTAWLDQVEDFKVLQVDFDPHLFHYMTRSFRMLLERNARARDVERAMAEQSSGLGLAPGGAAAAIPSVVLAATAGDVADHRPTTPAPTDDDDDDGDEDHRPNNAVETVLILREELEFFVIGPDGPAQHRVRRERAEPAVVAEPAVSEGKTATGKTWGRNLLMAFRRWLPRSRLGARGGAAAHVEEAVDLGPVSATVEAKTRSADTLVANESTTDVEKLDVPPDSVVDAIHPAEAADDDDDDEPDAAVSIVMNGVGGSGGGVISVDDISVQSVEEHGGTRHHPSALKRFCGEHLVGVALVSARYGEAAFGVAGAGFAKAGSGGAEGSHASTATLVSGTDADPAGIMETPPPPPEDAGEEGLPENTLQREHLVEALELLSDFRRTATAWGHRSYDPSKSKIVSVVLMKARPDASEAVMALEGGGTAAAAAEGKDVAGEGVPPPVDGDEDDVPVAASPITQVEDTGPGPAASLTVPGLAQHLAARMPVRKCWWEAVTVPRPTNAAPSLSKSSSKSSTSLTSATLVPAVAAEAALGGGGVVGPRKSSASLATSLRRAFTGGTVSAATVGTAMGPAQPVVRVAKEVEAGNAGGAGVGVAKVWVRRVWLLEFVAL